MIKRKDHQKFKKKQNFKQSQSKFLLQIIVAYCFFLQSTYAQFINVDVDSVSIDNSEISQTVTLTTTVDFFNFQVTSFAPYPLLLQASFSTDSLNDLLSASNYYAFTNDGTLSCTVNGESVNCYSCSDENYNTQCTEPGNYVQMENPSVLSSSATFDVVVTGFITPPSAMSDISIIAYIKPSDDVSSQASDTLTGFTAVTIDTTTDTTFSFTTDNTYVGYPEVTLTIAFTPQNQLAYGYGQFQFEAPDSNMANFDYLTNLESCTWTYAGTGISDATTLTLTIADGATDNDKYLQYSGLTQEKSTAAVGNSQSISCPGFINPVSRSGASGYVFTTQDWQANSINSFTNIATTTFDYYPLEAQYNLFEYSFDSNTQSTITVQESISNFVITLDMPIYYAEVACLIKLTIPPEMDFDSGQNNIVFTQGVFTPQSSIDSGDQQSDDSWDFEWEGCNGNTQLSAMSVFFVGIVNPDYAAPTSALQLTIYEGTSESDANIIAQTPSSGDQIVTIVPDFSIYSNFQPADISSGSSTITADDATVQTETTHTFSIDLQSKLYEDSKITITYPDLMQVQSSGLTYEIDSSLCSGCSCSSAEVTWVSSLIVEITYPFCGKSEDSDGFVYDPASDGKMIFTVGNAINQDSARDAGGWQIQTYNAGEDGEYYAVDTGTFADSFTATTGSISVASGEEAVELSNTQTSAEDVTYTFNFETEHDIPEYGYVTIQTIPSGVSFSNTDLATSVCTDCSFDTSTSIFTQTYINTQSAGTELQIQIGGFQNGRSLGDSGTFVITTFDSDNYEIDEQSSSSATFVATLDTLLQAKGFAVVANNKTNGALSNYQFYIDSAIEMSNNDYIEFEYPNDIFPPDECFIFFDENIDNIIDMECESTLEYDYDVDTYNKMRVTFTSVVQLNENEGFFYSFNISDNKNPPSLAPSATFQNIIWYSSSGQAYQGYDTSTTDTEVTITNEDVAYILEYSMEQDDYEADKENVVYTITFYPSNNLTSTASMVIYWPFQVEIDEDADVEVETEAATYPISSEFIYTNGSYINITDVFTDNWWTLDPEDQYVIITIDGVTNPNTNRNLNGFQIQTFADKEQTIGVGKIGDGALVPALECEYPCYKCLSSDTDYCTECWDDIYIGDAIEYYSYAKYLQALDSDQTCLAKCEDGFTSNGDPEKVCIGCDISCATCFDFGEVGDASKCDDCNEAEGYFYKYSPEYLCMTECGLGYYLVQGYVCDKCESPCYDCEEGAENCILCDQNSDYPALYANTCLEECPSGYALVDGVCIECESPCVTCQDSVDYCLTCDGTDSLSYSFSGDCYVQCPAGTTPNNEDQSCLGCLEDCALCDFEEPAICLVCDVPLLIFFGECVTECPDGYFANPTMTECTDTQIIDYIVIPFPFLFVLFCWCCLIAFMEYKHEDEQNSLPCILAFNSILEFVAIILQTYLSFRYEVYSFFYLTLLALLLHLIISYKFNRYFSMKFYHNNNKQEDFYLYRRQCPNTSTRIWTMMNLFSFKCVKFYYTQLMGSRRWMGRFWQYKDLGNNIRFFGIGHIFGVSALVLGIDIMGLTSTKPFKTQLWITQVETLVMSAISITAGAYEVFRVEEFLVTIKKRPLRVNKADYAEQEKEERLGLLDQKQRQEALKSLINSVKGNKDLFLNNKLDELLEDFGDRKCKSDIVVGNEKEEDPRKTQTWPLTPAGMDKHKNQQYTFSQNDRFQDKQPDNVYADGVEKQEESEYEEVDYDKDLYDAMNRKGANLLNPDVDEHRRKGNNKRRGRKNKYYTQIDAEDDEEADLADEDDKKSNDGLDVINEEEEEEARRQKELEQKQKEEAERKAKEEEERRLKQEQLDREQKEREAKEAEEKARLERERKEAEAKKKKEAEERRQKELEDERKRKEAEELAALEAAKKLKEEQERLAREKLEKEAAEKKRLEQEEEDRIAKEEEDRLAKEKQDKLDKEEAERLKKEKEQKEIEDKIEAERLQKEKEDKEKAEKEFMESKKLEDEIAKANQETIQQNQQKQPEDVIVDDNVDFKHDFGEQYIQIPPNADLRNFNENDILGQLERDDKGNPQVIHDEETNEYMDKQGEETNQRGYLIDPDTGNIIENRTKKTMFNTKDMDEKGEVPQPFSIEKFNFNPHNIRGIFNYDQNGKPTLSKNKNGEFIDAQGKKVNRRGFYIDKHGNIIDKNGIKKFDRKQLNADNDLPKLYTYSGMKFDIVDTMGQFDRDNNGNIMPQTNKNGKLIDNKGRLVNEKGYLIDNNGNIIDKEGKKLWSAKHLKNGEFPKIFPFTKFNKKNVMGQFEYDPLSDPILDKDANGDFIDNNKQRVNARGYLIDKDGNVIDRRGYKTFDKNTLDSQGEIPKVFGTGILHSDTASSLSRLMSEIEKNVPSDYDQEERRLQDEIDKMQKEDGQTSVDSLMEDTPANYNNQNQRFDSDFDMDRIEEEDVNELAKRRRKKKKKRVKKKPEEMLPPNENEIKMANAYGGMAKPHPKRKGIKYDKEQLRQISTPLSATGRRKQDNQLKQLTGSISGFNKGLGDESARGKIQKVKKNQFMNDTQSNYGQSNLGRSGYDMGSQDGGHYAMEQALKQKKMDEIRRRKANKKQKGHISKDADFEKMFGKDIDEFLEDSEWDIESFDQMSQFSKGTYRSGAHDNKLRGLEKTYLQRIEPAKVKKDKTRDKAKKPFREFQLGFEDQPDYVHRGNVTNLKSDSQNVELQHGHKTDLSHPSPAKLREGWKGSQNPLAAKINKPQ